VDQQVQEDLVHRPLKQSNRREETQPQRVKTQETRRERVKGLEQRPDALHHRLLSAKSKISPTRMKLTPQQLLGNLSTSTNPTNPQKLGYGTTPLGLVGCWVFTPLTCSVLGQMTASRCFTHGRSI
jgi:hypothetical protein